MRNAFVRMYGQDCGPFYFIGIIAVMGKEGIFSKKINSYILVINLAHKHLLVHSNTRECCLPSKREHAWNYRRSHAVDEIARGIV